MHRISQRPSRWLGGTCAVALGCLASACGGELSRPTGQQIPPRAFQFVEVLPTTPGTPGGWQIACVHALVGQGLPDKPHLSSRECEIQAQVPLHNHTGPVTRRKAQFASAKAANKAAYTILGRSLGVNPNTCKHIRDEMRILLGIGIKGARVTRCIPLKGRGGMISAPPVRWP